jgi:hypothetical protein
MKQRGIVPNGIEGDIPDGFLVTGSGVHVELTALSECFGLVPFVKVQQVVGAHNDRKCKGGVNVLQVFYGAIGITGEAQSKFHV